MSTKTDIQGGLDEMDYRIVDNGFIEMPSSKPAVFRFASDARPDMDALEEALAEHDFGLMKERSDVRDDGSFYSHFEIVTDHYKRVKVKAFDDTIRIFPREQLPDTYEFSRIIHAIEDAFGSEIEHDPLQTDE